MIETNLENYCWHRPEFPEEDGNGTSYKEGQKILILCCKKECEKNFAEGPLQICK